MEKEVEILSEARPQMIDEVLPRYHEANGDEPSYETVRSMMIDGHEVAWMEFSGTIKFDIMGEGREGQEYRGRSLHCACDFTEYVGWEVKDGSRYSLDGKKDCLPRKAAMSLRYMELRQEYLEKYREKADWGDLMTLKENASEIVLDMIEKAKEGELLEDGNGAEFWGGYFYLQTVGEVTGLEMRDLWKVADELIVAKKIGIEGTVIQPYWEVPPPDWDEYARMETDGYVGVASLPAHSKMSKYWKLEVLRPDESVFVTYEDLPLEHDPVFGPDVEDVAQAEERMSELLQQAIAEDSQATKTNGSED